MSICIPRVKAESLSSSFQGNMECETGLRSPGSEDRVLYKPGGSPSPGETRSSSPLANGSFVFPRLGKGLKEPHICLQVASLAPSRQPREAPQQRRAPLPGAREYPSRVSRAACVAGLSAEYFPKTQFTPGAPFPQLRVSR